MPNPFGVPELSPTNVAAKREGGDNFILLDVREPVELERANLGDGVTHVPLSRLAAEREAALPEEMRKKQTTEIVVMCHHGVRSAQVAAWLLSQGWQDVWNLAGGIDAYAREVDPSIGFY